MPSFLSKVFGRKKDDKESPRSQGRASDHSLLEGKFESVSPSATKFPEVPNGKTNGQGKDKDKDAGFTLFRAKSRPASPDTLEKRFDAPQLSLNLPGPKEDSTSRALGVVFEADPDTQLLLGESAIGNRRLTPLETLILVRACSQAITARGLETLGIMHPHWYSASPDIQQKLISLFIQSLAPKSPITTLSPTPSAFVSAFESEISSTRSPHDVAAVLRWGLRHLQLENNSFGKNNTWYKDFFEAEQSSDYPPNAFSTSLTPLLPPAHLELLTATLEILSSLAAHAEANGISGSKLSKFFGLWLLTSQRVEEKDDWSTFYARWERTGRMLEHLFLSRIRNEAVGSRMPTRLLELVHHYPYNKGATLANDMDILPRPRFSTRQYDALFVRIETEISMNGTKPHHHPLRLIADAFKAEVTPDNGAYTALWNIVRKAGTDESNPSPGSYPGLSQIFADETIRFLSLVPADYDDATASSSFNLFLPQKPTGPSRRRSFSLSDREGAAAVAAAATRHTKPATEPTSTSPAIVTDWAEFSTSGFSETSTPAQLATTLLDKEKDMEVTLPRSNKRSKASPISTPNGRKSLDAPRSITIAQESKEQSPKPLSKATIVSITQLDEAFIDFWSDALLDPITSTWPSFVICKIKSSLSGLEVDGKHMDWLIVEQSFKRPAPPPTPSDSNTTSDSTRRPISPKPSFKSDMTFGSTRKRFSFFTSGRASTSSVEKVSKSRKKGGHSPRVGEMGEVLAEEDEKVETVRLRMPSPKPKKSVEVSRKSVEVPRKSVDVARKSGENGKANGHGATGQSARAPVVVDQAPDLVASGGSKPAEQEPANSLNNGHAANNVAAVVVEPTTKPPAPHVEAPSPAQAEEAAPSPVVESVAVEPPVPDVVPVKITQEHEKPVVVDTPIPEPAPSAVAPTPEETHVLANDAHPEIGTPTPVHAEEAPAPEVVSKASAVDEKAEDAEVVEEVAERSPTPIVVAPAATKEPEDTEPVKEPEVVERAPTPVVVAPAAAEKLEVTEPVKEPEVVERAPTPLAVAPTVTKELEVVEPVKEPEVVDRVPTPIPTATDEPEVTQPVKEPEVIERSPTPVMAPTVAEEPEVVDRPSVHIAPTILEPEVRVEAQPIPEQVEEAPTNVSHVDIAAEDSAETQEPTITSPVEPAEPSLTLNESVTAAEDAIPKEPVLPPVTESEPTTEELQPTPVEDTTQAIPKPASPLIEPVHDLPPAAVLSVRPDPGVVPSTSEPAAAPHTTEPDTEPEESAQVQVPAPESTPHSLSAKPPAVEVPSDVESPAIHDVAASTSAEDSLETTTPETTLPVDHEKSSSHLVEDSSTSN